MKKLVLLFVIIISSLNSYSQINLTSDFELRYDRISAEQECSIPELRYRVTYNSPWMIVGGLNVGLHWKQFSFTNQVDSYFNNFDFSTATFDILFVNYITCLNWKYKSVEIGYKHNCFHPLWSSNIYIYSNSSDSFYLKIKIK
jgi:hypothetical protein